MLVLNSVASTPVLPSTFSMTNRGRHFSSFETSPDYPWIGTWTTCLQHLSNSERHQVTENMIWGTLCPSTWNTWSTWTLRFAKMIKFELTYRLQAMTTGSGPLVLLIFHKIPTPPAPHCQLSHAWIFWFRSPSRA